MARTWFRSLFTRPATRPIRKAPHRARLGLEAFEDRVVPTTVTFNAGSLIIPMDTSANGQNNGMLRAYGLTYDLVRNNVPVNWVINPGKAANGDDVTVSGTLANVETSANFGTARTYRGGPFVIAESDAAAALPIIQAWQATAGDDTTVHRLVTGSFTTDVARTLLQAPRLAVLKDGNESIAFNDLNAAGIRDSTGTIWSSSSPDLLTEAQVVGGPAIGDGALFNADGTPRYSHLTSMHYNATSQKDAVVQEVRAWLDRGPLTHAFMLCEAASVFENSPFGRFLTTNGIIDDDPAATVVANRIPANPLSQIDGVFQADSGSTDSIELDGGVFRTGVQTLFNDSSSPLTQRITMLTGRLDGIPDNGRVTYLAGHDYSVALPITSNPQTNGVRLFLNTLFVTDSVTDANAQADVTLTQTAPLTTSSNQFTITLSYANPGPQAAENVTLTAAVPTGASFVSATGGGTFAGGVVTWSLGTLAAGASGSQSFTVAATSDGTYTTGPASILFADLTVNKVLSNATVTVRDTVAPTVTIVSGPGGVTNDNTPTFAFVTGGAPVITECRIDGGAYVPASPSPASFTSVPLADGVHTFVVRAIDAAGNVGSATRTFTVDTAPTTASNLSTPETYTEDTGLNLTDVVVSGADNTVTATLTLSNVAAGSLSTATAGAVTSTYNAATGVWSASGAVANVNILLAGLTFNPSANFNASFTIATSVSDGAVTLAGSKVMIGVSVNDAPVLDVSRTPTLAAVPEDAGAPVGPVGTPVSALVDFATPAGGVDNVTDVDAGAQLGIAVTAIDSTNFTAYYSLNGGATWTAFGVVSSGSARLLAASANNRIYLQPNANVNGTFAAALTFRAWDRTSGSDGGTATTILNGGATAFSTATDGIPQTVVAAAALVSIEVTPIHPTVAVGLTKQFTATGIFSDGSSRNLTSSVTWASATPAVATVSNAAGSAGLAVGLAAGTSEIAARLDDVLGSVVLTVAMASSTTTVTGGTFTYDGNPHGAVASSVTGAGGLSTTATSFTYFDASQQPLDGAPVNAGTYVVVAHYAGDDNHTASDSSAVAIVIDKATLTITANHDVKAYGTSKTLSGTAFTQSGLVNGDAITGVTLTSTGAAAAAAAGSYDVVASAATGTGLSNYNINYVNGALLVGNATSQAANFNGTAIQAGNYVWFSSVIKPSGLSPTETTTIWFVSQTITIGAVVVPVPNASITYHPGTGTSSTVFTSGGWWQTDVHLGSGLSGNQFLSGLGYYLPDGLAGGTKNVTWSGVLFTDHSGVSLNWKWAAAVYTHLPYLGSQMSSVDYNAMAIKPVDDNKSSAYQNSDHAGAPEGNLANGSAIKTQVTGGATGGGGSNYTGGYSGTKAASPTSALDEFFIELGWMDS